MGLLTREQVLTSKDIKNETVKVPEWADGDADSVLVWTLNGQERDEFEATCRTKVGDTYETNLIGVRAKLCALAIRDESGERVFRDPDVVSLGRKSAAALERVFEVASRLSGITKKDIDDTIKN